MKIERTRSTHFNPDEDDCDLCIINDVETPATALFIMTDTTGYTLNTTLCETHLRRLSGGYSDSKRNQFPARTTGD